MWLQFADAAGAVLAGAPGAYRGAAAGEVAGQIRARAQRRR